ncbi:MAG TPA: prephenate dehydrogenase/arogenate dehydrogenase family protein [Candidatus Paceibacterota bacterium]
MKKISIIGFGRFGKTLLRLFGRDFEVTIFDPGPAAFRGVRFPRNVKMAKNLSEVFKSEVLFYAVPISKFGHILEEHKKYLQAGHLLVDVLSVKEYPAKILREVLKNTSARAMLSHPMFGPDSSRGGFENLPLILNRFTATRREFGFWKKYFLEKGLRVIEMTPSQHDRLAADSQGITHFIGRILEEVNLKATPIDSLGAKKLLEVKEQVCHDTRRLFSDLQNYNPYTKAMRLRVGRAYNHLYDRLLPQRIDPQKIIFGIQGGRGSFNEQAILEYIAKRDIKKYRIKYLFTSERVLRQLHEGSIDFGIFAIQNAVGGVVGESVTALSRYNCRIRAELSILIKHCLMKRKDNKLIIPKTIMAHDQVLKQCRKTLRKKYPKARFITGGGDLIDTARAAQALAHGKISRNTFILGPARLAELYDLKIVARDLQDNPDNLTTFLLVSR